MKKRILAVIMMMVMVMASAMSVSAAGSKTNDVTVPSTGNKGTYTVADEADTWTNHAQKDVIADIDAGKVTSLPADIQNKLSGKTAITDVFDLKAVGSHPDCTNGHTVTLTVSAIANCTDVVVLHYNGTAWEVVDATVSGTSVTFTLKNLSPVAIFAKAPAGTGTSPTTGMTSSWMLIAAMALIVVGAGVVVSQKKSR